MTEETKPTTAIAILLAAADAIEQRSVERDDADGGKTMKKTVALFETAIGVTLSESQGWRFMACLKLARSSQGRFTLDDYIDLAAYAALAGEAASGQV